MNTPQKAAGGYKVRKTTVWIVGEVMLVVLLALTPVFARLLKAMHTVSAARSCESSGKNPQQRAAKS